VINGATGATVNMQEWNSTVGTSASAFMNQAGRLSLRTTSVAAILNVDTATTTNIGAIIKGQASQTGDLQQWQNSAGSILGLVDAYGSAAFGGNNALSSSLGIQTGGSATQRGITVRGAASQTANLQEWQDSAGTVLSSIASNGAVQTSFISNVNGTTAQLIGTNRNTQFGNSASFGGGQLVIGINNATTVPTSNPTGGGVLYEEAGALKHRGSGGLVTTIAGATANSESTFLAQTDFLQSFFGHPTSGYDVFPRYFASSAQATTNGTMAFSLFTPVKTVTISTVTNQLSTGRLDYGYTSSYRGIAIYQCSGTNNTTLTPLAVTWDGDKYLWGITQNAPGTTATLTSASATTSGNFTLVTCVGSGASFTSGQWVTITGGTAGSPGFTSFTGTVVGIPSATGWILQRTGTSLVTGTMTGGTVTGVSLTNSTCTITSGTVDSGTGTVATVSIVHSSMAVPFSPGQWVNVTGSTNSFSGVVAESPAPTSTGFTMTAPSTLTSGSVGTGSAVTPDAFGRYVRPLFTPTASGTGVVTPASITLTAGTRYAIGFLSSQTGGTTNAATLVAGVNASSNQLVLPYLSLGLASQTTITTAAVTGGTTSAFMPWARLT
jgi:hypothetical protein